jgi:hypothetical protein
MPKNASIIGKMSVSKQNATLMAKSHQYNNNASTNAKMPPIL